MLSSQSITVGPGVPIPTRPSGLVASSGLHGPGNPNSVIEQFASAFKQPPDQAGIFRGQRRVKRGARGRRTSLFTSHKSGGSFVLESGLELAYALTLERDSSVLSYRAQAVRVDVFGYGFAYPDFVVRFEDRFEVHEVKASTASLGQKKICRFEALQAELQRHGIGFKTVTAETLPRGEEFERLCISYMRAHVCSMDEDHLAQALQILIARPPRGLTEAYAMMTDSAIPIAVVDFLLFYQKIKFCSEGMMKGDAS